MDQASDDRWLIDQLARQLHQVGNPSRDAVTFDTMSEQSQRRYLRMGAEGLRWMRWAAYSQSLWKWGGLVEPLTVPPTGWPPQL
jgi:hypothetical protein